MRAPENMIQLDYFELQSLKGVSRRIASNGHPPLWPAGHEFVISTIFNFNRNGG